MKKTLLFSAIILLASLASFAQPAKQWDKTFGGSSTDYLLSLQQTADGGYILGGQSNSGISGDKTEASRGNYDYWVVKLDSNGTKQWDKTFGGSSNDFLSSLQQTADGGYILGGQSYSGISGDKTDTSRGDGDYWVVKIDGNGTKQWDKTFGGSSTDYLYSLQQTADGGYILGGYSQSDISGDKTDTSRGDNDYWVVKLDSNGTKQWDKTFGGSSFDYLRSLQQTADGGYILGGSSQSGISGNKTDTSRGNTDYWVVKLDSNGTKQWDKTFGGSSTDYLLSLQQTADGGYILGGQSNSGISGDKTDTSRGNYDYWVVQLDGNGTKLWDKTFGGSSTDQFNSLQQTADGGYILGGYSGSGISGDKTDTSRGDFDYWVAQLDGNGTKQWDKTFGGSGTDELFPLQQTADGGYILGGSSQSGISGDKTEASRGNYDYWVVKLCGDPTFGIDSVVACDTFVWIDGKTYYASNDTATYIISNSVGCDSVITLNLTIYAPQPIITQDGHVLSTDSFASYQWYFNDTLLTGAESRTHTATAEGTYTVSVTDENDCEGVSQGYVFSRAGVSPLAFGEGSGVRIYPNPSQGVVNIEAEEGFAYSVYDLHGRLIAQGNATANHATIENLTSGLYFIRLQTGESVKTVKIIVE